MPASQAGRRRFESGRPLLTEVLSLNARRAYLPAFGIAAKRPERQYMYCLCYLGAAPMPKRSKPPSYRHHKARNCAVVTLDAKDHYLGKYGSKESHELYGRLIAEWQAKGCQSLTPAATQSEAGRDTVTNDLTIEELIAAFWEHAMRYYRHADGRPTREIDNLRDALRPLRQLYSSTTARDF